MENKEQYENRKLRELEGKNIAQYSMLLQAWIHTKMEHDKTLITLSSIAIGLLVTILSSVKTSPNWIILVYMASFWGFGKCIYSSLKISELNSKHIENQLRGNNDGALSLEMEQHDQKSKIWFMIGITSFCLIGIITAINRIT